MAGALLVAGALTLIGSLPTGVTLASAVLAATGTVTADDAGQTMGFFSMAVVRAAAALAGSFLTVLLALKGTAVPFLTFGTCTAR
ncbi:hypothetical protein ABZT03_36455 [Streptomyces sp. NPDC005574]|uniref:hypothetical protein n=1 Tax=Streptomyces sp. NPDC005574 TaxID=3156891 RepID=UPI0033B97D52